MTQSVSPRVTRKQRRELTDQLIMDAARAAFIEHGYDHTTLRDIARRAGRSAGLFFSHHAEKVDVLAEVLHHDLSAELSLIESIVNDSDSRDSVLMSVLTRDYDYWRSRAGLCQAWWSRHCAGDKCIVRYTEEARLQTVGMLHEVLKQHGVKKHYTYTRADIIWRLHVSYLQNISGATEESNLYVEEMCLKTQLVLVA